VTYYFAEAKTT